MIGATEPKIFEFIEMLADELSSNTLVFPTSVSATMRIRRALNDSNASVDQVARIVGTEPVLSAQLLRVSNSVMFGNRARIPVTDLRTAILQLGFAVVRNVTISVGMQQLIQGWSSHARQPIIDELWRRTMRIASLSYVIAKRIPRLNPDTAMLVGLLHDIGKFYILNRARDCTDLFLDEVEVLDVVNRWHATFGVAILQIWEIPEEIHVAVRDRISSIEDHVRPPDFTDILVAADFLDEYSLMYCGLALDDIDLPPALIRLKLNDKSCKELMRASKEELEQIFHAVR